MKIVLMHRKAGKKQKTVTNCSLMVSVLTVIFLALTGEAYAVTVVFLLLVVKAALLFRCIKAEC